jgi:hypothetical protein
MKKNSVNKKDSSAKRRQRVSGKRPRNNSRSRKNNNKLNKKRKEKQIVIKRSSGRHEKFDTSRMAQTVSRSGVPFLMARDVAENVSKKIRKSVSTRQGSRIKKKDNEHSIGRNVEANVGNEAKQKAREGTEVKTVNASQIRGMVAAELRNRNRGDIAASYSGQTPENTLGDQFRKQNENDRIAVSGATQHTRQPANRNRVIHDMSKRGGGIST